MNKYTFRSRIRCGTKTGYTVSNGTNEFVAHTWADASYLTKALNALTNEQHMKAIKKMVAAHDRKGRKAA